MKKYLYIFIAILLLAGVYFIQPAQADIYGLSLVSWWRMDNNDISGTAVTDRSGQGNTGTLVAGATITKGKLSQAMSLDGNNTQYMTTASLLTIGYPLTMCAWFYPLRTNQTQVEYSLLSLLTTWDGWYFATGSGGAWTWNAASNNTFATGSSGPTMVANKWVHVCGVATNATSRRIYVNAVAGTLDTSNITPSQVLFRIGVGASYRGNTDNYFNGLVDDVRIYNRALSASEVAQLYLQGKKFNKIF